jgi:hypothetical protein
MQKGYFGDVERGTFHTVMFDMSLG